MAEPDLVISAGFSDARLDTEVQKVLNKYKAAGAAAQKAFQDAVGRVPNSQAAQANIRELDKLKRAYDPVYVQAKRYESELDKLNRALQLNVVSQAQYSAELGRLNQQFGRAAGIVPDLTKAAKDTSKETALLQQRLQNTGFQVQDFAVQIAGGTSASRAFAQQFPQLVSGLGLWGVALGTAGAILVPLIGYLMNSADAGKTLEERLKDLKTATDTASAAFAQARTPLSVLRDQYGDLADEIDRANQSAAAFAGAALTKAANVTADQVAKGFGTFEGPAAGMAVPGSREIDASGAWTRFGATVQQIASDLGLTEDQARRVAAALEQVTLAGDEKGKAQRLGDLRLVLEDVAGGASEAAKKFPDLLKQVDSATQGIGEAISATQSEVARLMETYAADTQKMVGLSNDLRSAEEARAAALAAGNSAEALRLDQVIAKIKDTISETQRLAQETDTAFQRMIKAQEQYAQSRSYDQRRDAAYADYGQSRRAGAFIGGADAVAAARHTISAFEGGYVATPKWDVNAYRAGYGSETYVTADGVRKAVVAGVQVSKADADRDLDRRILAYFEEQRRVIGPAWEGFSPDQKAALASVQHNYGSLPNRIVPALQTGDLQTIASAMADLAMDRTKTEARTGKPMNYDRRMAEAAAFGDTTAVAQTNDQLQKQIDLRDKTLQQAKEYGEQLARDLVTGEQRAALERQQAEAVAAINASDMGEDAKAAAIAAVNGEMQKQLTIMALMEDAKRRQVDLDAQMVGSSMTYREAINALGDAKKTAIITDQQMQQEQQRASDTQKFWNQQQEQFEQGLIDSAVAGEGFTDMLRSIAVSFAKVALQAALFGKGSMAGEGGGTGLLRSLTSAVFGGFRERGGPVAAGRAYVVGEKRPELFVPSVGGTIVPRVGSESGGGAVHVTVSVDPSGEFDARVTSISGRVASARVAAADKALPGRLTQINRDPRRR